MLNKLEFEQSNSLLFERLKVLSNNTLEVYNLAKDYENLQLQVQFSDVFTNKDKNSLLLTTGRALSNIIEKIKSFGWYKGLDAVNLAGVSKDTHIVFLGHRGGLCNRLRAVAGLEIIANKLECEFSWSWFATLSCTGVIPRNAKYLSLSSMIERKINGLSENIIIIDDPNSLGFFFKKFSQIGTLCSYSEIYQEYVKVSKLLLDSVIYYYGLSTKVFDFIAKNAPGEYDSVHIRQTDFIEHFKEKYPTEKLPTVEEYVNHIQNNPHKKYFLSTDESGIRKALKDSCNNVFMWEHEYDSQSLRQTGFEETILDLAVMLNSDSLVITPHSSFSQYVVEAGAITPIKLT